MKLILPIILALIGVAAGGYVGYSYVSSKAEHEAEAAEGEHGAEGEDAHAMDEEGDGHGGEAHGAADAHGDGHGARATNRIEIHEAAEDSEYLPLSRKLIVPFVRTNGRKAFVAVDATLEIGPGETEFATLHEPKVIDAFLRVLINFASTGAFDDPAQASATLRELNEELYNAAKAVLGDRVRGVLIVNILTQDD